MEQDKTSSGMARQGRHVYGPRPVAALVPGLTRAAFRAAGGSAAQLMIDWPVIVGPALAAVTEPRRLSQGTLTIACSGPIAMELQHMALELMSRINAHLGRPTVRALRFTQVALLSKPFVPPPAPAPARVNPAVVKAVEAVPPGPLRDALSALGTVLMASKPTRTRR